MLEISFNFEPNPSLKDVKGSNFKSRSDSEAQLKTLKDSSCV